MLYYLLTFSSNQCSFFGQWKFAYISLGRPDYFEDSDIVATKFQVHIFAEATIACSLFLLISELFIQRNMYGAWEQYLGLEHPDTAPRKSHTVNQVLLAHCLQCGAILLIS